MGFCVVHQYLEPGRRRGQRGCKMGMRRKLATIARVSVAETSGRETGGKDASQRARARVLPVEKD